MRSWGLRLVGFLLGFMIFPHVVGFLASHTFLPSFGSVQRFLRPGVTEPPSPSRTSATRRTYPGESIEWEDCGYVGSGRAVECGTITVPIDQFDTSERHSPDADGKIFTIPLIRMRNEGATQNLLFNPGGPGASGINAMYRFGEQLSVIVDDKFHMVAFDPRGVNSSTPAATCYPDDETRKELGRVKQYRVLEDSVELYAWTQNYVRACADTMGEYGQYLNTPQTAADLNSILDALGQRDMVYWGFSYGTILGQTYASMFPERSQRVIIDGVNNIFDWYEGLLDEEDLIDSEAVFDGFLEECIKARDRCPLAKFASSKEGLREFILDWTSRLRTEPTPVYTDSTRHGVLDETHVLYEAIFPALLKPARWYETADRLAKWLDGQPEDAFNAYMRSGPQESQDAFRFVMLNDGMSGSTHWPQDRETILEWLEPFIKRTTFGPTEHAIYYSKQQWVVPKTHTHKQPRKVKTAHPLLILTMSWDPVCPLISAQVAQSTFEGSQIVEVLGYGHCSMAMPSLCLAKHAQAFLINGTLPDGQTQCDVDGDYFINPDEMGKGEVAVEAQRLYAAQVTLARNLDAT